MKKQAKRTLSLALAIIMLVSLMCLPALAESSTESQSKVFHYVSLGASNSNGYALHGYLTEDMYANPVLSGAQTGTPGDISGYRSTPAYSYPALVKEYLESQGYEVDHDQLAQSSMRVEELRFLIDPEFTADDYTSWRFYDPDDSWTWWYSNLDELRADYEASLKEADLITYDMGLNNFGVYLTNNLLNNSYGNDLHRVVPAKYADMYYSIRSQIEAGIASLGIIDVSLFKTLDNMTDTLAYAILGYCVNFDATMKIILNWNPDATIVVLNVQNIMAGLEASLFDVAIPFGDILGIATNIANTYTSLLSPYAGKYLYADTTKNGRVTCFMDQLGDYNGDPSTLDLDMRDCLDVYDTTLPMYLKFRVAAQIAASMGDAAATTAVSNEGYFKSHLPYFVEYCETNCPELYERTLENAYDTMMTVLQASYATNPIPLDGLLENSDTSTAESELKHALRDLIADITAANLDGDGFDDADIQESIGKLLYSDTMKTVAAIGVRSSIGNTFFSHPNRQGCRELFNAIVKALDGKIKGYQAFAGELSTISKTVTKNTIKFGVQFPKLFITKIMDAFNVDKATATQIANNLDDSEYVIDVLGGDEGAIALLEECIDETQAELKEPKLDLSKVNAKKASLFAAGNIEYYICKENGKLYYDADGLNQITDPSSVLIPRLTVIGAIKNIFSFRF